MQVREINLYWKEIINTINDGLILIAPDGAILMVNESFEKLTGYQSSEIIGKSCTMLHCDACDLVLETGGQGWCTLFSKEFQKKCECNLKKSDGTFLHVLKKASVLKDEQDKVIGAVETITDLSEMMKLDQEVADLSRQLETSGDFYGMIGKSPVMQTVFDLIIRASENSSPVIIYGESGTGKELVAHAIHTHGLRKNMPFVQLNCAALSESLIESELFGHTKGAFTGAMQHRIGRFEAARGGDIFLDEIGDIPLSIQVKLLRVLESKMIERVGDNQSVPIDVRIISATNKDLYALIAEEKFREDFFFRINVIPIHLPPLRDRTEDIPLLINSFLRKLNVQTGKHITRLDGYALEAMLAYSWPGNIRELKSSLEYAFVLTDEGQIPLQNLPPQVSSIKQMKSGSSSFPEPSVNQEKEALISALRRCGGNQSKAARILNVSRVTVWNRIKKYGIDLDAII